jgi:hypothetical protein
MKDVSMLSRMNYRAIVERDIAYLRSLPASPERERQIEALRIAVELYVPPFSCQWCTNGFTVCGVMCRQCHGKSGDFS